MGVYENEQQFVYQLKGTWNISCMVFGHLSWPCAKSFCFVLRVMGRAMEGYDYAGGITNFPAAVQNKTNRNETKSKE